MIRVFRQHVPAMLVALGLIELALLFASAELAWIVRSAQIGIKQQPISARLGGLVAFTLITWTSMLAVGVYHAASYRSSRVAMTRMAVAIAAALIALALLFYMFREVALWRSIALYAVLFAFVSVLGVRWLFLRVVGWKSFRRRVLVLGAGSRAAKLERLAASPEASFLVTRFVRMTDNEPEVLNWQARTAIPSAAAVVEADRVSEVVVAVEERRGALPLDDLLQIRMTGVRVTDISSFVEQETGRVDLDSVRPSWLIFTDGYGAGSQVSIVGKRLFDLSASLVLLLIAAVPMLITALLVRTTSAGTIFYRQQRVGRFGKPFDVIKFRSMRADAEKEGKPIWASKSDPRVTAVGRIIRLTRLDELPQLLCVLKGDMSFVGPRPERPFFVADLAQQIPFYNERHVVKPGITGWAQINYQYGASVEDARCKLEYDLYYIKNYSLFLDLLILIQTVRVVLWQDGSR
jgi:sugar transferase (PEP-CTERM system associated)